MLKISKAVVFFILACGVLGKPSPAVAAEMKLGICKRLLTEGSLQLPPNSLKDSVQTLQAEIDELNETLKTNASDLEKAKVVLKNADEASGIIDILPSWLGGDEEARQAYLSAKEEVASLEGEKKGTQTAQMEVENKLSNEVQLWLNESHEIYRILQGIQRRLTEVYENISQVQGTVEIAMNEVSKAEEARDLDLFTSDKPNEDGSQSWGQRLSNRADQAAQRAMQASMNAQLAVTNFNITFPQMLNSLLQELKTLANVSKEAAELLRLQPQMINVSSINLIPDSDGWSIFGTDGFFAESEQLEALNNGALAIEAMEEPLKDLIQAVRIRQAAIEIELEEFLCTYREICLN